MAMSRSPEVRLGWAWPLASYLNSVLFSSPVNKRWWQCTCLIGSMLNESPHNKPLKQCLAQSKHVGENCVVYLPFILYARVLTEGIFFILAPVLFFYVSMDVFRAHEDRLHVPEEHICRSWRMEVQHLLGYALSTSLIFFAPEFLHLEKKATVFV